MSEAIASLPPVPRAASGTLEPYLWKDGVTVTWRIRVRWHGHRYRLDLGTNREGWSAERAQGELERILGMIDRGSWRPPRTERAAPDLTETVQVTVSRWWDRRQGELRPNTRADYRWRIDLLLAAIGRVETSRVDVRQVDDVRHKLANRGLSARSVNMVLDLFAQVLDDAVEYELLAVNPARGRRRRMKVARPARSFLEADQLVALLDAAGAWEAKLPEHQRYGRRQVIATLAIAGLRVSELIGLDRGHLDLAGGRLHVVDAKTPAGVRHVELTAFLHDELLEHVARQSKRWEKSGQIGNGPLFPTWSGGRLNASNLRNRLLTDAATKANDQRPGLPPLPAKVTPHTLRRTFASLALAGGRDPRWVMAQLGHTDARLTLSVYAQVMQRQRVDVDTIRTLMAFPETGGGNMTAKYDRSHSEREA